MSRRVILDTNVLIALERGEPGLSVGVLPDDDIAIAAISYAELWTATELAETVAIGQIRQAKLDRVAGAVFLLEYTRSTAIHHARLIAHARRSGQPRGAHDLVIAAHALESARVLVTRDAAARFEGLPGIQVAIAAAK